MKSKLYYSSGGLREPLINPAAFPQLNYLNSTLSHYYPSPAIQTRNPAQQASKQARRRRSPPCRIPRHPLHLRLEIYAYAFNQRRQSGGVWRLQDTTTTELTRSTSQAAASAWMLAAVAGESDSELCVDVKNGWWLGSSTFRYVRSITIAQCC